MTCELLWWTAPTHETSTAFMNLLGNSNLGFNVVVKKFVRKGKCWVLCCLRDDHHRGNLTMLRCLRYCPQGVDLPKYEEDEEKLGSMPETSLDQTYLRRLRHESLRLITTTTNLANSVYVISDSMCKRRRHVQQAFLSALSSRVCDKITFFLPNFVQNWYPEE